MFRGPAGILEGLWKEASVERRGSGVFAHPHPLHGGTMHSKVVYRAAQALTRSGYATLRFNFRGVGLSEGEHDAGRGEVGDFRAALDEARRQGGLPIVAGGFSFGSAVALRAIEGDPRIAAFIAAGLPVATESVWTAPRPRVPALFVVGERDTFGPPDALKKFVGSSGSVVILPDTSHFFEGRLEALEEAIGAFLVRLPQPVAASQAEGAVS
jgi:alpha/beta superfamily hydrolase